MYILAVLAATVLLMLVLQQRPKRRPGAPFDWSYRRPWWRPRWLKPDDR